MVEKSSQEIIQSLVSAEIYGETEGASNQPSPTDPGLPLVTVSRSFGCNGTDIAAMLADRLQVQLYDRILLKEVARTAKSDHHLMGLLDERVTTLVEDLVQSFVAHKKNVTPESFNRAMVKVIMGISRTGGVIVGRGAHLLLPNRNAFRLRLEGSMDVCTQRISARLGIRKSRAAQLIKATNRDRTLFVKKIYRRYSTDKTYYDMVLNTDLFQPEQIVDLVVYAMKTTGFKVP